MSTFTINSPQLNLSYKLARIFTFLSKGQCKRETKCLLIHDPTKVSVCTRFVEILVYPYIVSSSGNFQKKNAHLFFPRFFLVRITLVQALKSKHIHNLLYYK